MSNQLIIKQANLAPLFLLMLPVIPAILSAMPNPKPLVMPPVTIPTLPSMVLVGTTSPRVPTPTAGFRWTVWPKDPTERMNILQKLRKVTIHLGLLKNLGSRSTRIVMNRTQEICQIHYKVRKPSKRGLQVMEEMELIGVELTMPAVSGTEISIQLPIMEGKETIEMRITIVHELRHRNDIKMYGIPETTRLALLARAGVRKGMNMEGAEVIDQDLIWDGRDPMFKTIVIDLITKIET
mmetsp:Transcript_5965/g.8056  ORF Transcript_5965/g.8056 Transcript_5965/m.8056 type:complete len:238 (-) Transcript_5965:189-902(-)